MRFRWGCWVVGALAGCSGAPDGALRAVVQFQPASVSQCVVVEARGPNAKLSTGPINRKGKAELKVGIHKSTELSGKITVQAIGYAQEGCPDGTQIERSAAEPGDLDATGVNVITLVLDRTPQGDGGHSDGGTFDGGFDPDGDGDLVPLSIDCNDADPQIFPGQVESCANNLDDNCNNAIDCNDPFCLNATCTDNNACTVADKCVPGNVCLGTLITCATPGTCEKNPGGCVNGACVYLADLAAPCGDGGVCRSDRSCGFGEANCANGIDDDADGGADCLDPACDGQDCDAGTLLCYARAACGASMCAPVPASMITCAPPPGGCFSAGACAPDAGCTFTPAAPGAACPAGSCRADGGCGPSEAGAFCANGIDDDDDGLADCADPSCAGGACTDNDACTTGTTCSGTTCGGGSGVVCPSAGACNVGQCLSDAGCVVVPAPGPCGDGGVCAAGICFFPVLDAGSPDAGSPDAGSPDAGPPDAGPPDAGTPVLDGGFQYVPSNFNPAVASIAPAITLSCNAVFDAVTGLWLNGCLQPVPNGLSITQSNGELAWLLPMRGLTIDMNASLRLQGGGRPVIIAVYGNANLNGPINARSAGSGALGTGLGPGANWSGCAALNMNGGNGGQRQNFGAGGGGAAFATDGGTAPTSGSAIGGAGGVGRDDPLIPLHGGCRGGNGGGTFPPAGGAGGGAVQVSVSGNLRVNQFISASGGGGRDGPAEHGGGGAGSGGAIFLEANTLELTSAARLTCNGGGGAEGGGQNDPGADGDDGSPTGTMPAIGGPVPPELDNSNGGNGGNGAGGSTPAQPGQQGNNSSGGGGGGLGHVRLRAISSCLTAGAVVSGVLSKTPNCPP